VLLSVANPRPQKRLERLPAVLSSARAELLRRGVQREARLVIVGDADPRGEVAAASMKKLREAIASEGMEPHVRLTGSMDDVTPALFAADAMVSVSAHEGLSLAHLEALAAGLPVVATDAGGTAELLAEGPAITVLPLEAEPERVAAAAVDRALQRPDLPPPALTHFTRDRMAERYAGLYRRTMAARQGRGGGLLLVTNNFSTGGAQSSARRLLLGLLAEGVRVRAAVLEEQPEWPTPGRRALESAGVPVLSLPAAGTIEAALAVEGLLAKLDEDPPDAVLFWNALAPYKVRIADALLDVPVFDVSPGEMYFASLARHFQRSHPGLPYRDARAYGARLAGVIVKYAAEAAQAAEVLGTKVFVVPNGVALGPPPPPRRRREKLVIGTAARISPQKKLEELIDALRLAHPRLPPWELRVAGGPERGSEEYAKALQARAEGLPIAWLGDLPETGSFLAGLDLFAMISEPAGCPNASLEAMAAGLAVVATDVGGASEQVVDGVTGRLLPRGDVQGFAEALIALGHDEAARQTLGAAGRARAEALFDVRRMVADYRQITLGS
jgi:glycosyltransferase involved in cell wall biosynthesis